MKAHYIVAIAVGVLTGLAVSFTVARPQSTAPAAVAPADTAIRGVPTTAWEYLIIDVADVGAEHRLNSLGAEGWELVAEAPVADQPGFSKITFKRPRR
jgi:hypothetical protein